MRLLAKILKYQQCKAKNVSLGQDKIHIFDFIRAVACIYIVLTHFLLIPIAKLYNWKGMWSGIGMEMFFFTTGFLIPLSLERCNWKQFAVKRFFRLMPVLTLAVITYILAQKIGFINKDISIKNIITNLTMTTDLVNISSQDIMPNLILEVGWSMQVELKFYIIAAIAFCFGKTMRKKFFILLGLCLFCYISAFIFKLPNNFATSGYCLKLVSCCFLGSIYFFYKKGHISNREFLFFTISFIMLICGATGQRKCSYAVGAFFVLIVAHFFSEKGNNKIVKCMANLSYSVYLFHDVINTKTIELVNLHDVIKLLLMKLLILITIFVVCRFIYYYIEKPAYDFGRRLASKIK